MSQPSEPYDPNSGYPQYPQGYPHYPQGYPQNPQDYPQYPQYSQSFPVQPGQPGQPGYPGYPGYPPTYPGYRPPYGIARPGNATAANVLAYITAGLLIAAGLLLFLGASIVDGLDDLDTNSSHSLVTAELIVDGMLDLIAAGLLIAGAVSFGNRNPSGRVLLSVGSGIVLGDSVYWVVRTGGGALFWAMVFAALVIISLALAWTSAANIWARAGT